MKFLVVISFIFSTIFAFGQDAAENMKEMVFGNPFHSSSQSYISIMNNKNIDRELNEYLEFDAWTPIEILNHENEVLKLDSANYFIPEKKILFFKNGQMMEVFPDQVQKVKIGKKEFAPFVDKKNENRGLQFFEVLAGAEFKILKTKSIVEEKKDIHPMGISTHSETKLVERVKFYYVREGTNTAIAIPRSKSKFIKAFKKHKKKVIKYVEKRNLSLREEEDLIVIARYYNFLLNEK